MAVVVLEAVQPMLDAGSQGNAVKRRSMDA